MIRLSEAVKHLLIINVLMYFGSRIILGEAVFTNTIESWGWRQLALFHPQTDFFEPYQIVTHMFMHANERHLLFNMLGLFFLGPMVENALGTKRFLFYYLSSGFGAMLLHLLIQTFTAQYYGGEIPIIPMLGASGAIYGILIGFAILFPNQELMLIFPPIPIKAKYMALGLILLDTYAGVFSHNTGVAHFAHIGGAIAGALIILYWKGRG